MSFNSISLEPSFLPSALLISPDVIEEWLRILIQENKVLTSSSTYRDNPKVFKYGKVTEVIFNTCEKLNIAPDAKYLAVDLFEKFMIQHVYDLHEHVVKNISESKTQVWNDILGRVKHQLILRVVTCCQLASKLTSHYKIVNPRKAWHILNEFGQKYNHDSILQSEIRVAKTLKYKLMIKSPLVILETLLVILGKKDKLFLDSAFYNTCTKVLDMFYLCKSEIYKSIKQAQVSGKEVFYKEMPVCEQNKMLIGVGVIVTSIYILHQTHTDAVIEILSRIVNIESTKIIDFATVIIKSIVQDS